MANLIDYNYFVNELNIPNVGTTAVQARLVPFIAKYEEDLLSKLLGYEMYKTMMASLNITPPGTPDQIWLDLRDGKEYTYSSRLHKWKGLRNTTTKESLVANYVYYWWMRNEATQTSAVGETVTKTENSERTSPDVKMARAWNELVCQVKEMRRFLLSEANAYPLYVDAYTSNNWEFFEPINTLNL